MNFHSAVTSAACTGVGTRKWRPGIFNRPPGLCLVPFRHGQNSKSGAEQIELSLHQSPRGLILAQICVFVDLHTVLRIRSEHARFS